MTTRALLTASLACAPLLWLGTAHAEVGLPRSASGAASAAPLGLASFGHLGMRARVWSAKTLPGCGNHGAVGEPT